MISPKLFITTTRGVAFAVSLGLSHGVVDLHHLRCSGTLERDRPLSRNSAALLRLVTSSRITAFPAEPRTAEAGPHRNSRQPFISGNLWPPDLRNLSCIGIDAAITAEGLVVSDIAGVWKRSRSI